MDNTKSVKLLNDAEKLMSVNQWTILNELMDALDNQDEFKALMLYTKLKNEGVELEFTYQ